MNNALAKANSKLQSSKKSFSKSIRSIDFAARIHDPSKKSQSDVPEVKAEVPSTLPPSMNLGSRGPSVAARLFQVIDFLKSQESPQTASQIYESIKVDVVNDAALLEFIQRNPKVAIVDGTYAYKPTYDVKSKEDLLGLLKGHYESGLGGMHVRELKDTWKGISKGIDELEGRHKIFVIRHKDRPAVLFYNEMAEISSSVSDEFKELWKGIPVPDDADVQRALTNAGLKLLEVIKPAEDPNANEGKPKKKPKISRSFKRTNKNITGIDLSVDYVPKK